MADNSAHEKDRRMLHALGYAQELRRGMSGFSNFAISFTIISILSGTLTLYATGLNYGGPVEEAFGWPIVSVFVIIVALGMAEIASKYPTAGGLYYWASKMGGPVWGWFTGWFNLIGQIAITAGIDYGAAIFTDALLNLLWPGTFNASPHEIIYIYAVHPRAARADEHLQRQARRVAQRHLGVVARLRRSDHRRIPHRSSRITTSPSARSSRRRSTTAASRTSWLWFVLLLGFLQAQYTFTGYDASAHMSEETQDASRAAARGVVMSVVVSAIFGYILALAITFAIQTFDSATGAGIFAVKQILLDSLGLRAAEFLLFIIVGAQLYCGMSSITSASRMLYAFSRDGATPGHRFWRRLNAARVPYMAVLAIAVLAFLCAFPAYFSKDVGVGAGFVAYAAVTSIATIGLYIAYAIPIYLRLRLGDAWEPGEWNLGRWYKPIGTIARHLGGVHLGAVHPADHADRDPVQERVHVVELQLRADRGHRHVAARRRLVGRSRRRSGSRARCRRARRRSWRGSRSGSANGPVRL